MPVAARLRTPIRTEAFLANLPLFRGLPPEEIARLAAGTTRRSLRRGATLFSEGQAPTGVHAVVYGRVGLFNEGPGGRERFVDVVGPGRSFGEPVLFLEKPYIVSARALSDSLVLHVAKETVFAELARNPRFASRIIGELAGRAEGLVRQLQDAALGPATQRFAAWLLRQRVAEGSPPTVALGASKRLLAAQLKLSPEHLSRILHQLAEAGTLAVRGRSIAIADRERLLALAEGRVDRKAATASRRRSSPP